MATLNSRTQILSRPQIQTGQQPIPRQVILPPKAVAAPNIPANAVSMAAPIRQMPTPASTNMILSRTQAMPMSATPLAPVRPVPRVITDPVPTAPPVAFNPNMQSTQAMQQPQYPVNAPDINSPLFSGYSAPMPNNMYNQPNYVIDVKNPLFAGVGAMPPSSDYGSGYFPKPEPRGFNQGPKTEDDWNRFSSMARFASGTDMAAEKANFMSGGGFMRNMANLSNNMPDVNNPLFAGYSAPMPNNMYNPMYNAPDVNDPLFAGVGAMPPSNNYGGGMGGGMGVPYNSGTPMGGSTQPFNQTMPQTGFVPMGGYNPQNTSYGSFGAIQQPTGGFQNIGSLLGRG
jgi:hypothetical protein